VRLQLPKCLLPPPPALSRMAPPRRVFFVLATAAAATATAAAAALLAPRAAGAPTTCHVANALSSHMVLQRDRPALVWGFADAGVRVTVSLNGVAQPPAVADASGAWRVALPAQPATAAPSTLAFSCSDGTVPPALEDVLFGDVVLCSGQVRCRPRVRAGRARTHAHAQSRANAQARRALSTNSAFRATCSTTCARARLARPAVC
jgi:hypothetical protein